MNLKGENVSALQSAGGAPGRRGAQPPRCAAGVARLGGRGDGAAADAEELRLGQRSGGERQSPGRGHKTLRFKSISFILLDRKSVV